jgi:hypothetical protein
VRTNPREIHGRRDPGHCDSISLTFPFLVPIASQLSHGRQSFFADGTPRRLEVRQREALMQIKHRERAQQRGYAMQHASRHVQSVTLVTI